MNQRPLKNAKAVGSRRLLPSILKEGLRGQAGVPERAVCEAVWMKSKVHRVVGSAVALCSPTVLDRTLLKWLDLLYPEHSYRNFRQLWKEFKKNKRKEVEGSGETSGSQRCQESRMSVRKTFSSRTEQAQEKDQVSCNQIVQLSKTSGTDTLLYAPDARQAATGFNFCPTGFRPSLLYAPISSFWSVNVYLVPCALALCN